MTTPDAPTLERAPEARRRNAEATRTAILGAAKTQFALSGYEAAFLRDIAADAGVDAALINRYFGGKEGLFAACLREAVSSDDLFSGERASFGRRAAKAFAAKSAPAADKPMLGFRLVLQAATSANTAHMLNEAVQERFMGPIRDWLGGEAPQARARLISALFIGLLVEGRIRDEPLTEPERSQFIERLATIFQTLVDG